MKYNLLFLTFIMFFVGCSKEPQVLFFDMPKTHLVKSDFSELPNFEDENYSAALNSFINNCASSKTKKIYKELCRDAVQTSDPKKFILDEFIPYKISTESFEEDGLLTGYYEPQLNGSLIKKEPFVYPIYATPNDMFVIDLGEQYPELKSLRLRGKLEGNKIIPYYDRQEAVEKALDAEIICYTDSKVDLFFLEVQGSGRVTLEDGKTIFVGYDNQNGHRYKSIGKYLVEIGEIPLEEISLQSIRAWFDANPHRVDEVLNYNKSMVFFRQKDQAATGSLGLELTPDRSVAVDREYIPLGSMLYLDADIDNKNVSRLVVAQDTGGAIKGSVRADMFCGYGEKAREIAGKLKAPLRLWILLPKDIKDEIN
ncbi:MAG: MltA domain-containing protein [Sulfurimonas sp.]|uniref:murein transglycosylase A n=1 Tax=Sulfurimonas sp. TaxID=2022749 RepID=UPI00262B2B41|nr:MltA domain-containing protein [Sulfurimonas sp.]MCW8894314.1 MltA domain-containing protein [Sulfurimonas sp.]MCW8954228.1 MltA domain-containing protein [Sulfurimonas sp.]MCW9067996.1 MltA domain-containing protein [Sulfurimonas sp.]